MVLDDYDLFYEELKEELQTFLPEFAFMASMMTTTMEPSETPTDETMKTEVTSKPTKFQEAWDHEDPIQRNKWRDAIKKELRDMINRRVFWKVKRSSMPQGKQCVKNKWVFKIKRNGVF